MVKRTKVNVFMTSFNHEKYVHSAIVSVLNQTFPDFHLIIVDDGSTDGSWKVIKSFEDPRITAIKLNSNSDMRHVKIEEIAQSNYLAIQHSDDIWEPTKLAKQVKYLEDNPQVGAVFSYVNTIDEMGNPWTDKSNVYYKLFDQPNRTRHEWLNYFFYHRNALCNPSVLVRQTCFKELGYYRTTFFQLPDLDFWVQLCLKYEIYVLAERLIDFRIRAGDRNTSGNRPDTHIRTEFEFLQILDHYKDLKDKSDFLKVFPQAGNYLADENSDIGFALAMISLEDQTSNVSKLFGIQLLFEIVNDVKRFERVSSLYDFSIKDYHALTGRYEIFSTIPQDIVYRLKKILRSKFGRFSMYLIRKIVKVPASMSGSN